MALNLSSVRLPKSQVLGPFLPTNEQNGCSLNDAEAIVDYLKSLPQTDSDLHIVAYSTQGSGSVDLKWLHDNCKDLNLPLQLTIEGFLAFPQSASFGGEPSFSLQLTGTLAADLARGLQGSGRPMIESFLSMLGMTNYQLDSYYLCLKPIQDTITYTFSKF